MKTNQHENKSAPNNISIQLKQLNYKAFHRAHSYAKADNCLKYAVI